MNDVEKKLMDEFANTTLQSAFQHSEFASKGYEDKAEFCYRQAKAMVQARAKAQGSSYSKNEAFTHPAPPPAGERVQKSKTVDKSKWVNDLQIKAVFENYDEAQQVAVPPQGDMI